MAEGASRSKETREFEKQEGANRSKETREFQKDTKVKPIGSHEGISERD